MNDGSADAVTATLAEFVVGLGGTELPAAAVSTVEHAVTDSIGVALAGSKTSVGQAAATLATETTAGATVLGTGRRASPTDAAFANGTATHALELDDGSRGMFGHPSTTLVPAVFALGEVADVSGPRAVTAYVAGFEVLCSLASAANPAQYERGWHATATLGAVGAAAAGCVVLDCPATETRHALGLAVSMAAGLRRNFGADAKPAHAGHAARAGVTAARLAQAGVTAADAIEGPGGFLDVYAGNPTASGWEPPDGRWAILDPGINIKLYPCCYYAQAGIAAALRLRDDRGASATQGDTLDTIRVRASPGAAEVLAYHDPETPMEAKFSMEYTVARALVHGDVDQTAFTPGALSDETVRRVAATVEFVVDPDLPYGAYETTVTLVHADGTSHSETVPLPPGAHGNPLPAARFEEKFLRLATATLSRTQAEVAFETLSAVSTADGLRPVVAACL